MSQDRSDIANPYSVNYVSYSVMLISITNPVN